MAVLQKSSKRKKRGESEQKKGHGSRREVSLGSGVVRVRERCLLAEL